jgi:hypothetical protein
VKSRFQATVAVALLVSIPISLLGLFVDFVADAWRALPYAVFLVLATVVMACLVSGAAALTWLGVDKAFGQREGSVRFILQSIGVGAVAVAVAYVFSISAPLWTGWTLLVAAAMTPVFLWWRRADTSAARAR